jgi:hypothetical protein
MPLIILPAVCIGKAAHGLEMKERLHVQLENCAICIPKREENGSETPLLAGAQEAAPSTKLQRNNVNFYRMAK